MMTRIHLKADSILDPFAVVSCRLCPELWPCGVKSIAEIAATPWRQR